MTDINDLSEKLDRSESIHNLDKAIGILTTHIEYLIKDIQDMKEDYGSINTLVRKTLYTIIAGVVIFVITHSIVAFIPFFIGR